MYVVEFQKRGLPHVHMLIWLDSASKHNLQANVDKYVSAEIPDPVKDPVGHAVVQAFMIHGPCGKKNLKCQCMKDNKCSRHFSKKYCPSTTFDQSGFPIYKRRSTGITVKKGKSQLDNQWVVQYNRDLLVKYQCHINVEGKKRRNDRGELLDEPEDEINSFFDGRYICGCEAAYRIFGFNIHCRSLSVLRLSFHLPGNKSCTFRSSEPLNMLIEKSTNLANWKPILSLMPLILMPDTTYMMRFHNIMFGMILIKFGIQGGMGQK
nr:PREDICTED: uncharacterized protein LOC108225904 [Daucus carota subsp. sativus]